MIPNRLAIKTTVDSHYYHTVLMEEEGTCTGGAKSFGMSEVNLTIMVYLCTSHFLGLLKIDFLEN